MSSAAQLPTATALDITIYVTLRRKAASPKMTIWYKFVPFSFGLRK